MKTKPPQPAHHCHTFPLLIVATFTASPVKRATIICSYMPELPTQGVYDARVTTQELKLTPQLTFSSQPGDYVAV
ncbi:hypothetical protein BaRGS_00013283, partial [Batillaria attramentaria]